MNRIRMSSVIVAVLALGSAPGRAADSALAGAPPAGAQAVSGFGGFHLGGHIGYSPGNSNWTSVSPLPAAPQTRGAGSFYDRDGIWGPASGGFQAGYNHLISPRLLFGFETDISFPDHLRSRQSRTSPADGSYDKVDSVATLTADCQFVADPAYNRDRGPVSIMAVRLHAEF